MQFKFSVMKLHYFFLCTIFFINSINAYCQAGFVKKVMPVQYELAKKRLQENPQEITIKSESFGLVEITMGVAEFAYVSGGKTTVIKLGYFEDTNQALPIASTDHEKGLIAVNGARLKDFFFNVLPQFREKIANITEDEIPQNPEDILSFIFANELYHVLNPEGSDAGLDEFKSDVFAFKNADNISSLFFVYGRFIDIMIKKECGTYPQRFCAEIADVFLGVRNGVGTFEISYFKEVIECFKEIDLDH